MIEQTVLIKAPILDVFDYLIDVQNFGRWAPYFIDAAVTEVDDDGWPCRYRARLGMTVETSYETDVDVADVQRGRWITYRSVVPPQIATYSLQPSSAGTLLTASHNPWTVPGTDFLRPALDAAMLAYLQQCLSNLKMLVEGRPASHAPVVFLSYRRDGDSYVVGRVVERLAHEFGDRSVFRDISSISVGGAWRNAIDDAVTGCAATIIMVNQDWREVLDRRETTGEGDVLREEVVAALSSGNAVLPVALRGVDVERQVKDLPADLSGLAGLQWQPLRDDPDFESDMERIVESVWTAIRLRGPAVRLVGEAPETRPQMSDPTSSLWSAGASALLNQWRELLIPPAGR